MPLESGLYVSSLVPTNPTSGDPKSQGDDHLRLIKAILQQTLNNFPGTIVLLGADVGAVNTYTINPTLPVPAYTQGMTVIFGPAITNTGPVTLNVSSLGPVAVTHASGSPVAAGELPAGRMVGLRYDGTGFQIVDGAGFLSKSGNQKLTGTLDVTGAITSGGAGTFAGALTATGSLTLNGAWGNVKAYGTGTNDLSAGTTLVKTLPAGSPDSNQAVSVAMLNAQGFSAALPGQSGQGGKVLYSDGASATWQYKSADPAFMALGII